jgi:hypothetical protein
MRFILFIIMAFAAMPAVAQSVDAGSPWRLSELIREEGYKATIESDSNGNPVIRSAADGLNFSIYFYSCRNGQDCKSVQFSSGFRMRDPLSVAAVNDWNGRKRYTRAWRDDDGNAFLRMDLNLIGGVSEQSFRESVKVWTILLRDYVKHIGWRE